MARCRQGLDFGNVEVSPPRDASHGDLACNAAMVLAKAANMKPRDIADKLAEKLRADADIAKVEVAGPGFLNLRFHPGFWQGVVTAILEEGPAYGRSDLGRGERVNVEYVSANPTGPHARRPRPRRGVRRCAGNLLQFAGYDVTREYYVNDAGGQVDALARSAYLRYREALGEDIGEIPAGLYPGDYLKPVGKALADEHGHALLNLPEERWLPLVRDAAIAAMMAMIKEDLAALNIRARRVLLGALAHGRQGRGGRDHRGAAQARASSSRAGSRSPRATTTRSGRIASRRCSSRPRSATMSTAR